MWSEWSNCIPVQCGVGNRTRSRSCDSPPPSSGGKHCEGYPGESEECNTITCLSNECKKFCNCTEYDIRNKVDKSFVL